MEIGLYVLFKTCVRVIVFFFFQAEDGIRDYKVTGVQTCALPIFAVPRGLAGLPNPVIPSQTTPVRRIRQTDFPVNALVTLGGTSETVRILSVAKIGRASCRERV